MNIIDNTTTITVPFSNLENGAIFKNAFDDVCMKIPTIWATIDTCEEEVNVLNLSDYTYDTMPYDREVTPLKAELILNF